MSDMNWNLQFLYDYHFDIIAAADSWNSRIWMIGEYKTTTAVCEFYFNIFFNWFFFKF